MMTDIQNKLTSGVVSDDFHSEDLLDQASIALPQVKAMAKNESSKTKQDESHSKPVRRKRRRLAGW